MICWQILTIPLARAAPSAPIERQLQAIQARYAWQISASADFSQEQGVWIACQSTDQLGEFTRINEAVILSWKDGRFEEVLLIPELFVAFALGDYVFFCWDERKVPSRASGVILGKFMTASVENLPFRMAIFSKASIQEQWHASRDFGDFLMAAHEFVALEDFSAEKLLYWDFDSQSEQMNMNSFRDLESWQQQKGLSQTKGRELDFEDFIHYGTPLDASNFPEITQPILVPLTESRILEPPTDFVDENS